MFSQERPLYPLAKISLVTFSSEDQVSFVRQSVENHLFSVDTRIRESNIQGIASDVARFYGLGYVTEDVRSAWRLFEQRVHDGTGMTNKEVVFAATTPQERAEWFAKIKALSLFSPLAEATDSLYELKLELESEEFAIAYAVCDKVITQFPGLHEQMMNDRHASGDEQWNQWVARHPQHDTELFHSVIPTVINFFVDCAEEIKGIPLADALHTYGGRKKYQVMEVIFRSLLSSKEQESVNQISKYAQYEIGYQLVGRKKF